MTLDKPTPQDPHIKWRTAVINLSPVMILGYQGPFCSRHVLLYVVSFKSLINSTSWGSPLCTCNNQSTGSLSNWPQMHSEKVEELGLEYGSSVSTPPWLTISRYFLMELVQGPGILSSYIAATT